MSSTTTETTAEVIVRMLKGDGRYWSTRQRNKEQNFESEPEAILIVDWTYEGEEFGFKVVIHLYHWLKDRLEYNPDLDERYRAYCEEEGLGFDLQSASSFVDAQEHLSEPFVVSTLYQKDLLSQTIFFIYWADEERNAHVILEIAGRDSIGPVAFDVKDDSTDAIFDNRCASVACEKCSRHWGTLDGEHWVPGGGSGKELQQYLVTETEREYPVPDAIGQLTLPIDLPERPIPDIGVIWVDEDDKAHCPGCGGVLEASPWPAG